MQPFRYTGAEALDNDIGVFGQFKDNFQPFGRPYINGEVLLAAVECHPVRFIGHHPYSADVLHIVNAGGQSQTRNLPLHPLNFNDFRAHVRQHCPAEWRCHGDAEIQYLYTFQRVNHMGLLC